MSDDKKRVSAFKSCVTLRFIKKNLINNAQIDQFVYENDPKVQMYLLLIRNSKLHFSSKYLIVSKVEFIIPSTNDGSVTTSN